MFFASFLVVMLPLVDSFHGPTTAARMVRQQPSMVIGRVIRRWRAPSGDVDAAGPYCTTKAVVVGASGNVGKMVTARMLEEGYCVTALVRSWAAGDALYDYLQKVHVCPNLPEILIADICAEDSRPALKEALKGAERVVVTTGTTAFPTKAWAGGRVQSDDVGSVVWRSLWDHSFDRTLAMNYLTNNLDMNTPEQVDHRGVERVAECLDPRSLRRCVLMSSLGVTRRDEFPFTMLNSMGVLDAKAKGEDAIKKNCEKIGAEWSIVRPGQLFGPPYDNNFYLGTLFELEKSQETQALDIHKGDASKGDTTRTALADVLVHSLDCTATKNTDFTVLTVKGRRPDKQAMDDNLHSVLGGTPRVLAGAAAV
mmetsp:Transcript_28076/g.90508  ORF Transcript_28076/g.90508 Transcript_28076/m.90508 type:complete len:367 (+) Transcript_28076:81-1181(+)